MLHVVKQVNQLLDVLYNPGPPEHTCDEIILSLDAEKAFKREEWDYHFKTLVI